MQNHKKNILIFARDPGGCNSVAPLVTFLTEKKFNCYIYAKDFALIKMRDQFALSPENLNERISQVSYVEIENLIKKLSLDYVVTGTSYGDFSERLIWSVCRKLNIPTMAILDHWVNYSIRFQVNDGQFEYPTWIVVQDEMAQKVALTEGIPKEKILCLGNPYNDYLSKVERSPQKIRAIRNNYGVLHSNQKFFVFASEGFSLAPNSYGFNELFIIEEFIKALIKMDANRDGNFTLLVRPHPKEEAERLREIVKRYQNQGVSIFVDKTNNVLDLIMSSDLNFGMMSQFLVESYLLRCPTISLQLGLNENLDPFVLSKMHLVERVIHPEGIVEAIRRNLNQKREDFLVKNNNCMNKILEFLEK